MKVLDRIPPQRREAILQRAEHLIREERARRSAPDQNQNTAAPRSALVSFLGRVLIGCVLGIVIGFLLGAAFPQNDPCLARVSSQHVSICLDTKIENARSPFR